MSRILCRNRALDEKDGPAEQTSATAAYRLLRALSTVGIFHEVDDKRFVGSPMSDLLRTDHPRSIWGWAAYIGRPHHRKVGETCCTAFKPGQDAPHNLWGSDLWQSHAAKPEEIASFNAGQAAVARTAAPAIIAAYDFSKFARIVDVGGTNGALLAAILGASPTSSEIVFDLPPVVREATPVIRTAGLDGRCEILGGSYWDGVAMGTSGKPLAPSNIWPAWYPAPPRFDTG